MTIAVILGGADNLGSDLAAALKLFTPDIVIATNHAGKDYEGHVDHWVTMHPEKMMAWVTERHKAKRPAAGQLWKPQERHNPNGLDFRNVPSWGGGSGLLAVTVAVRALKVRAVLCGVPMQAALSHYDDKKKQPWRECPVYIKSWMIPKRHAEYKDYIRSMSGWTREFLGHPTREWLDGK